MSFIYIAYLYSFSISMLSAYTKIFMSQPPGKVTNPFFFLEKWGLNDIQPSSVQSLQLLTFP